MGRVLRATALDELPQLWTILRGKMSFVAPRPLAAEEIARDREGFDLRALPGLPERHRVRPGLTGIAQLRMRHLAGLVTYRRQFRYDRFYVRHRWWGLDLRLVLESLWISVRAGWDAGD